MHVAFQHDYFTHSLQKLYFDAYYSAYHGTPRGVPVSMLNAHLGRRNYLIVSAHPWDPHLEPLLHDISNALTTYRTQYQQMKWDVIFYAVRGIRRDTESWRRIKHLDHPAFLPRGTSTQDLLDFMDTRIGTQLPNKASFGSGNVYWMHDDAIVAEWEGDVELEDFVGRALTGSELPHATTPFTCTLNVTHHDTDPSVKEFVTLFHESVQNYVLRRDTTRNSSTLPSITKYHEKTLINLHIPRSARPPVTTLVPSYYDLIESFYRKHNSLMPADVEFAVHFDDHTSNDDIRLEKVVIEFDPRVHHTHDSRAPSTLLSHHSLQIAGTFITPHHRITTLTQSKPPSVLLGRWLDQMTPNWIAPFNSHTMQKLAYSHRKIVILFVNEHDTQQWEVLRRRLVSLVVQVHQNHSYLKNNLVFLYAKQHLFSEYFARIDIGLHHRDRPHVVVLDQAAQKHHFCFTCLSTTGNDWIIEHDAMIAFLYQHISNKSAEKGDSGEHYFSHHSMHEPTSLPYHDSVPHTILNTSLLHSYQQQSKKSAVILYFYVPMCAHCLKFYHDLNAYAKESSLEVYAHDFYRSNISSTHEVRLTLSHHMDNGDSVIAQQARPTLLKDAVTGFPSIFAMHRDHIQRYSGSFDGLMPWVRRYHEKHEAQNRFVEGHADDKVLAHDEL